jgi:hypothetical protein
MTENERNGQHLKVTCPYGPDIVTMSNNVIDIKDDIAEIKDNYKGFEKRIVELEKARAYSNGMSKQSQFDWKTVILLAMMLITLTGVVVNYLKGHP